jgi:hypothetical protein
MNVETAMTKKGGNGVVSGWKGINVISKKFSTKEAPGAVVNLTVKKIFLQR